MSDVRQKYEIDTTGAVRSIDNLSKRIDAYNKVLDATTKQQTLAADKAQALQSALKSLPTTVKRAETAVVALKDRTYELRDSFNALNRRTTKLAESTADANRAMKAFTRSLDKERETTRQLLADTQTLIRAREQLARTTTTRSTSSSAGGGDYDYRDALALEKKRKIHEIFVSERLAAYKRIQAAAAAADAKEIADAQRAADIKKQINKIFVSERLANIRRIEAEEKAAAARLASAEKVAASVRIANFKKTQAALKSAASSYFASGNATSATLGLPAHLTGAANDAFKKIDADKARARQLMDAYKGVNRTWLDTISTGSKKNKVIDEQTGIVEADGLSAKTTQEHYDHWRITSIALSVAIGYLAHRAIAGFIQEARDAVIQARDLSLRIAEIQTVSLETVDGMRQSALATHQWEVQLLALSQAFGVSELQVAEGLYQALSNQVIEAGDSVAYMTENLKLSITTTDTLDDTVSATSTVINAFNKNVAETSYISAVLFKTVEVGRLRLAELGSQFGRVSVLSRDLGITFEEQAGAIALLTRLGLKADVAMTLLTNVQLKLIKPTAEMTALFNEWGVTSGQAAIATFGFQGVLQKLAAATTDSGDRLAELGEIFQDLRAITGAQGLVGNLGLLNKTIDEVSNGTDDFRKAFEISMESIGRRANVQLQKLSQLFLVQFGQPTLELLVNLAEGFGGADNAMGRLLQTVQQGVTLYVSYRAALFATNLAMGAYNAVSLIATSTTTGLTVAITAQQVAMAGTTLGLGVLIALLANFALDAATADARFNSFLVTLKSKKLQEVQEALSKINDELSRTAREADKATNEVFQKFNILVAGLRAKNIELKDDFEKTFKAINKSMVEGLDKGVKAASDKLRELDDKVKTLEDKIAAETKAIADKKKDAEAKAFDLRVEGMKPEEAIAALTERAKSMEARALEAATKGELDVAEEYRKRADELQTTLVEKLRKLREEAEKAGKIVTSVSATGTRIRSTTTNKAGKIVAEVGPRNLGKGARVVSTIEVEDKVEIARLDKLIKEVADSKLETEKKLFELREKGLELSKKELETVKAEREAQAAALSKFQDVLPKVDSFDFNQKDALPKFKAIIAEAKKAGLDAGLDPGEMIAFLRQAKAQELLLERQVEQEKTRIKINEIQKRFDAERAAINKANADEQAAKSKNQEDIGKLVVDSTEALARIKNQLKNLALPGSESLLPLGLNAKGKAGLQELTPVIDTMKSIQATTQALQDQQKAGKDTADTVAKLAEQYATLDQQLAKINAGKNGNFDINLRTRLGAGINGKTVIDGAGNPLDANGIPLKDQTNVVREQLDAIAKNKAALDAADAAVKKAKASVETLNTEFEKLDQATRDRIKAELEMAQATEKAELEVQNNLGGTVEKYKEILSAIEAIEQKKKEQKEQMDAAGIPPVAKAHGGRLGTDSMLLAATPGEMVMNRGASRRYEPMLRQMNASGNRGSNTNVSNVTFGDIRITTAPGTSDAQAAEIMRRVTRMTRRGVLN